VGNQRHNLFVNEFPAFASHIFPSPRFDYAGEVHVFGDDDATIERSIIIHGRGQYPPVARD
jgi:hypothetical protein